MSFLVPGTAVLHKCSSTYTDKAFPGAFFPAPLNNQASGHPSTGVPWYLQAAPPSCKSPGIAIGGKQKPIPHIQALEGNSLAKICYLLIYFWVPDLPWRFSSQKIVNKWRGRRQHSFKKTKKVWKGTLWDTDAVVWKLSPNTHNTGANSLLNSTALLEQHPKKQDIFWLSYLYFSPCSKIPSLSFTRQEVSFYAVDPTSFLTIWQTAPSLNLFQTWQQTVPAPHISSQAICCAN